MPLGSNVLSINDMSSLINNNNMKKTSSPFKSDVLSDRVALITGGGSGIGLETAEQLGLHGCKVAIVGRRVNVLDMAVKALTKLGIKALACPGDVRLFDSCKQICHQVYQQFGSIDILINGAAGNFLCPAESLTSKGFKTVMEIDTQGTFNMTTAALSALKKSKFGGNVINISANLHYTATWFQLHASAAKAANDAMAKSFALEFGEYNIRCNSVAPGPIADTPGLSKLGGSAVPADQLEEFIGQAVALRRMGRKEEVAYAIIYLCSDAAKFITGSTIVIDGGQWFFKEALMSKEMVQQFAKKIEKKSRLVGLAKL